MDINIILGISLYFIFNIVFTVILWYTGVIKDRDEVIFTVYAGTTMMLLGSVAVTASHINSLASRIWSKLIKHYRR